MNDQDRASFDPRIADWLEDDPNAAPEPTLQIVLAAFPSIRQRHAMRLPRRFPTMSTMPKLALGAAAVTAIVLGGALLTRPPSSLDGVGVPPPSASPSPSPRSSTPLDTTTWKPFTSSLYGYSAAVPMDWIATPAQAFWTVSADSIENTDMLMGLSGNEYIYLSSVSTGLRPGETRDQFLAKYFTSDPAADKTVCDSGPPDGTAMTIDGHVGHVGVGCNLIDAYVWVDDRFYEFGGWGQDSTTAGTTDAFRALFDSWISTVKLDPASAVDPPAPSQNPAPS